MHFVRITPDSSRDDLAEAATHLRKKQANETDPLIKAWLSEDIDDLLDLYTVAVQVPR